MAGDIVSQGADTINATGAALSYFWGQCTRWVAEQLSWVQGGWGNAYQWLGNAQRAGFATTGPTLNPPVGSIAVWGSGLPGSGGFGHVAEVVQSGPAGFQVSEENWLGQGITDVRNVADTSYLQGFILPPGGARVPNLPPDAQAALALNPAGLLAELAGVVPGAPSAGQAAGTLGTGLGLSALGQDIAGIPTSIGHGLANATGASIHDIGVFAKNNVVGLIVALVVALVIFGGSL